jgi:hypothetical protein
MRYLGLDIVITEAAIERKENWPNKKRSSRLYKKLTKNLDHNLLKCHQFL